MRPLKKLALAASLFAMPTTANAACVLSQFDIGNGLVVATYDPFDGTDAPTMLAMQASGNADCANGQLTLSIESDPTTPFAVKGSNIIASNGSDELKLHLTGPNGFRATDSFAAGTPMTVLRLGSAGEIRSGDLSLMIPPGQRAQPGSYKARLKVTATPGGKNGGDAFSSNFEIIVEVLPSVGLGVASQTLIDIGTISDGATGKEAVRFRAYGNTGYELAFESDNDFGLVREGSKDGARIDYQIILGRNEFENDVFSRSFSEPRDSKGFREHELNVRVPEAGRNPAGTYSDYITVKINANVSGG